MNSKELVNNALKGKDAPGIPTGPLAVHYCAGISGVTIREYTLNSRILADSVIQYYEQYTPDAVWVSADTWVTAEAMGAAVAFPDENQPMGSTGELLIKSSADMNKIPVENITGRGRIPVMLEAMQLVKKEIGKHVFIVGCFDQSPWSLACALMGMENAMMKMITDQPFIENLLEICIDYCVAYGKAMAKAGADMLSTGDSPAGLIGKEFYQKIVLPAEQKVFSGLKETGKFLSLHICGDATNILADMSASGADVLEIDSLIDMEKACQVVDNDLALWGNLNPVDLLENGNIEQVKDEIEKLRTIMEKYSRTRFVLSSGCTLTMNTNAANLKLICSNP